jgi:hypothetical protein
MQDDATLGGPPEFYRSAQRRDPLAHAGQPHVAFSLESLGVGALGQAAAIVMQ